MAQQPVLIATSVAYYSENDETAFFEWLDRVKCVESYRGEGRDLFITLNRHPTKDDLRELLAIFYRYGVDMSQLARFETRSNRAWFRGSDAFWHGRVFGELAL